MEIQNERVVLTKAQLVQEVLDKRIFISEIWLNFKDGRVCQIMPSVYSRINPHLFGARSLWLMQRVQQGNEVEIELKTYTLGKKVWAYESALVPAAYALPPSPQ